MAKKRIANINRTTRKPKPTWVYDKDVEDRINYLKNLKKHKDAPKLAGGGLLEVGSGALGGAGSGASMGTMFGGPFGTVIGAGVGALAGGISSWINRGQRKDAEKEYEEEQERLELERRISSDSLQMSQYANEGRGIGDTFAKGGSIKQLASNMGKFQGASHEEGGIDYGNAEVEGEEVVREEGNESQVFSDELGFADVVEELGKAKGQLEIQLADQVRTYELGLNKLLKGGNKYDKAGNQRVVEAYEQQVRKTTSEIKYIDKAINEIFEQQQAINQGHSNEGGMEDGMAQPTVPQEGMSSKEPMMRKGGKLKAKLGSKFKNNWGHNTEYGIGADYDMPGIKYSFEDNSPIRNNNKNEFFKQPWEYQLYKINGKSNYNLKLPAFNPTLTKTESDNLNAEKYEPKKRANFRFRDPAKLTAANVSGDDGYTSFKLGTTNLTQDSNFTQDSNLITKARKAGNWINDNKTLATGLMTTAGNLFSNISHMQAAKDVKVPKPKLSKSYNQEARFDVTGQMKQIKDSENKMQDYIERNVSNPALARQIMSGQSIRAGATKASIMSQKENIESQIRGGNLQNIQNVDNTNISKQEQYAAEQFNKTMGDIGRSSQVSAVAMNDLKQTYANVSAEKYQQMQLALEGIRGMDNIMENDIKAVLDENLTLAKYTEQLAAQGIDEDGIAERISRVNRARQAGNMKPLK